MEPIITVVEGQALVSVQRIICETGARKSEVFSLIGGLWDDFKTYGIELSSNLFLRGAVTKTGEFVGLDVYLNERQASLLLMYVDAPKQRRVRLQKILLRAFHEVEKTLPSTYGTQTTQ